MLAPIACVAAPQLSGQELLADVFPGVRYQQLPAGWEMARAGEHAVFGLSHLWVSDGTPAGTQRIWDDELYPRGLVSAGRIAFFIGTDEAYGTEPWRTDGTTAGTFLLRDVVAGPNSSRCGAAIAFGERMLFVCDDRVSGPEPWISDGTSAGTFRVADIRPGPTGSGPSRFAVLGSRAYFAADDGSAWSLWETDGSVAGTRSTGIPLPATTPMAWNGRLWFGRHDAEHGVEPWSSDGTLAGTSLLLDLAPGTESSNPFGFTATPAGLVFAAGDAGSGRELWITDGTAAGTRLWIDVAPGPDSSHPQILASSNGLVFFHRYSSPRSALWRTDGTALGTFELSATVRDSYVAVAPAPNGILFVQEHQWNDGRLYASDGTRLGTRIVALLGAPRASERGVRAAWLGDRLLVANEHLWSSDGTPAGTVALTSPCDIPNSSSPRPIGTVRDLALFAADDGVRGSELWCTDGTPAGTRLCYEFSPGPLGTGITEGVRFRDRLLFTVVRRVGDDSVESVWSSDGTSAGTRRVSIDGGHTPTVHDGRVYFLVERSRSIDELWTTDGTSQGSSLVATLPPPHSYDVLDTGMYASDVGLFLRRTSGNGVAAWCSDGTAAGTRELASWRACTSNKGGTWCAHGPHRWVALRGRMVFGAHYLDLPGALARQEVWVSDGTPAGTRALIEGLPIGRVGDEALFLNSKGLWRTDGTDRGTRWILPPDGGFYWSPLVKTELDGTALMAVFRGGRIEELLATDGTASGTQSLGSTRSSSSYLPWSRLARAGNHVVFPGRDEVAGVEPWITDGTRAGTRGLADVRPGRGSSMPDYFLAAPSLRAGPAILFRASDPQHGEELWSLPWPRSGASTVAHAGDGCARAGRTPAALEHVGGWPRLGNASFALRLDAAPIAAWGSLLVSAHRADLELAPGCVLVPAAVVDFVFRADATGRADLPIPLPSDASALGCRVVAQAALLEDGGPVLGRLGVSDALVFVVGR